MSPTLGRRFAALAVLSLLSALAVVVMPPLTSPAEASTGKWTGHVSCDGQFTDTGLDIQKWDKVKITATGSCYFYAGAQTTGEGLYSYLGERLFTTKAPAGATAPTDGRMKLRLQDSGYDNNYGDGFTVTVTVNLDLEKCKTFTTTVRYTPLRVKELFAGLPVPAAVQPYLDRALTDRPLAYMQLKGDWCYKNGRVTSRAITPVQSDLTSWGVNGLTFRVRSTATGAISEKSYGQGATRYQISQTKAVVSVEVPFTVSLKIPGTQIGITVPAGAKRDIYTMKADTVLTGAGNGSCSGTEYGPCTIELSAERPK